MPGHPKDLTETQQDCLYRQYLSGGGALMLWLETAQPIKSPRPITATVRRLSPETRRELKMRNVHKRIETVTWLPDDTIFCQLDGCDNHAACRVCLWEEDSPWITVIANVCNTCANRDALELMMALEDEHECKCMANGHCEVCGEHFRGD